MEEKWIKDPLSGIMFGAAILCFGAYLALAAIGDVDICQWGDWWHWLMISIGIPLFLEFPIRYANPRYRMHGMIYSRHLIGITLICIGISAMFNFPDWWPALVFIVIGWSIISFSLWRLDIKRARRR